MTRGMNLRIGTVVMAVALTVGACSSSTPSVPASEESSVQPSSIQPSATPVVSGGPLTIKFVTPVPKPTWHAKPFKVRAKASDGSAVAYVADGVCTVKATTGLVTVDKLGKCTIIANVVDADPPLTASQTFTVAKAQPVITFDNSTTRFARPFRYRLPITVTPAIPLKIVVDRNDPRGTNDEFCVVSDGVLMFDPKPTPGNFPQIPAKCVVRVSATGTKNYDAPKPDSSVITIALADFKVNVDEIVPADYSNSATVKFSVREGSGDAFGVEVYSNEDADIDGDNFLCDPVSTTPYPAPGGTTRYTTTVKLQAPPSGANDCEMTDRAVPVDYQGGKFLDNFTIHVEP
jgi:hypothetical protein